jgi:TIR domain
MTPQPDQADQPERWDFFIAYASDDWQIAERIYGALSTVGRTFLDRRCLQPGDNWPRRVSAAQENARSTVLVVTAATPSAWYSESEYLRAIELRRRGRHTIVPMLYGEGVKPPYGLEQLHAVRLAGPSDIETLPELLRHIPDQPGDPPSTDAGRAVPAVGDSGATAARRGRWARSYRPAALAVVAMAVTLLLAAVVLARAGHRGHPAASPTGTPTATRAATPWTGPVRVGESGLTLAKRQTGPLPFDHGDLIYLNNSRLTAPLGVRRWERPGAPGRTGCSAVLGDAAAGEDSPTTGATYCLHTSRGGIAYLTVTAVYWRSLTGQLLVWPP